MMSVACKLIDSSKFLDDTDNFVLLVKLLVYCDAYHNFIKNKLCVTWEYICTPPW